MNIFEGARFGDKFRTRDGRRVLYLGKNGDDLFPHCVYVENEAITFWVQDDGSISLSLPDRPTDIVGKWKEPIDDGKLDRLASSYAIRECLFENAYEDVCNAYRAGYRKAKGEQPNEQ